MKVPADFRPAAQNLLDDFRRVYMEADGQLK